MKPYNVIAFPLAARLGTALDNRNGDCNAGFQQGLAVQVCKSSTGL